MMDIMDVMTCFLNPATTCRYSRPVVIVVTDAWSAADRRTVVAMAFGRQLLLALFWLERRRPCRLDNLHPGRPSSYYPDRLKLQLRLWQQASLEASPSPCLPSGHLAEVTPIVKLDLQRGSA